MCHTAVTSTSRHSGLRPNRRVQVMMQTAVSLYYEADVAISFARVCPDHTNCEIGSVGNVDAPGQ